VAGSFAKRFQSRRGGRGSTLADSILHNGGTACVAHLSSAFPRGSRGDKNGKLLLGLPLLTGRARPRATSFGLALQANSSFRFPSFPCCGAEIFLRLFCFANKTLLDCITG